MTRILVNVHPTQGGGGSNSQVQFPSLSAQHQDVVYRVSWGASETMERLFINLCASSGYANNHGVDMLTIYGDSLAMNFINLLMTSATQHDSQAKLRGISNRCMSPQKQVNLAVSRRATIALGTGGANFHPLASVVRPTGIHLNIIDRAGSQVIVT